MAEAGALAATVPGVRAFPTMPQGLGGRFEKPLRFVIGGGTYEELAEWRDKILERAAIDIAISEHILFTTDQTAMRAIWRGSLALTQPTAFAAVAGFIVQ